MPCLGGVLCAGFASPVSAQLWWAPPEPQDVGALRVDASIALGVEWVKQRQLENGRFPGHDKFPMGMTSLCLLTMAKCGVPPGDPAITKALDHLRYLPFKKTYSTGCLLMALAAIHPRGAKDWARQGVDFLKKTRLTGQGGRWSYPDDGWETSGTYGTPDLSNTQYAILGLRAAKHLGVSVPSDLFTDAVDFVLRDQQDAGAFRYNNAHPQSGSMNIAGLTLITVAEQEVGRSPAFRKIRADARAGFKRSLAWLKKRYTMAWNQHGDRGRRNKQWLAYYLYGIERLCDTRGMKRIGKHDWYQDGARFLLANQAPDGNWGSLEDTCFALLFLSRSNLSVSRELRLNAVEERRRALAARRVVWDALPRKPVPEVPFIRDWLIVGPERVRDDDPFHKKHPRPRGTPKAGAVAEAVGKRWRLYRSPTDEVDLERPFRAGEKRLAYVATLIRCAARTDDAILWLGTRDSFQVWLNGRSLRREYTLASAGRDRWGIPLRLRAGRNELLIKLEDHAHEWTFTARITAPDGQSIPDFDVSPTRRTGRKR